MSRKKKSEETTTETAAEVKTFDPAGAEETPRTPSRPQPDLPAMEGPGVALPQIDEIDIAAEDYLDVRNQRQELTKVEVDKKAVLMALMHKHNLDRYQFSDYVVTCIRGKENVKVRTADNEADAEENQVAVTEGDGEGV